jgi:hypothetical protein
VGKRASISTRTRFEIFKRDGFKCVYCGRTPMESPLHVDHVDPDSRGGPTEPGNLVTACQDCNLGKSDVPLDQRAFPSKLEPEQIIEHAEQIKGYLEAQRVLVKAKSSVADEVLAYWEERVGSIPRDLPSRLPRMIEEWGVAKLCEAIDIVAARWAGYGGARPLKYLHGILRNWREDASGSVQAPDESVRWDPPAEPAPEPSAPPAYSVECPACGNSGPAAEVYEHAGPGKDPRCRRCKRWRWPQFTR